MAWAFPSIGLWCSWFRHCRSARGFQDRQVRLGWNVDDLILRMLQSVDEEIAQIILVVVQAVADDLVRFGNAFCALDLGGGEHGCRFLLCLRFLHRDLSILAGS